MLSTLILSFIILSGQQKGLDAENLYELLHQLHFACHSILIDTLHALLINSKLMKKLTPFK